MFRDPDRMEGGPGDPKDFAEWWAAFKPLARNVLLPIVIAIVVILILSAVGSAVLDALR